ncbi:hypothetical protein C8J56DRAFT_496332 [Mycena floridula]|nr:hypothetical protein C8J56DRAFT_496332 [Mycena floridula]
MTRLQVPCGAGFLSRFRRCCHQDSRYFVCPSHRLGSVICLAHSLVFCSYLTFLQQSSRRTLKIFIVESQLVTSFWVTFVITVSTVRILVSVMHSALDAQTVNDWADAGEWLKPFDFENLMTFWPRKVEEKKNE